MASSLTFKVDFFDQCMYVVNPTGDEKFTSLPASQNWFHVEIEWSLRDRLNSNGQSKKGSTPIAKNPSCIFATHSKGEHDLFF